MSPIRSAAVAVLLLPALAGCQATTTPSEPRAVPAPAASPLPGGLAPSRGARGTDGDAVRQYYLGPRGDEF